MPSHIHVRLPIPRPISRLGLRQTVLFPDLPRILPRNRPHPPHLLLMVNRTPKTVTRVPVRVLFLLVVIHLVAAERVRAGDYAVDVFAAAGAVVGVGCVVATVAFVVDAEAHCGCGSACDLLGGGGGCGGVKRFVCAIS